MVIKFDWSAVRRSTLREHLGRFVLGGMATVVAGLVSKWAGPVVGGLFLAFPAILPAGVTLLEKHEREKKQRAGISFTLRGRLSAALDARGAALGSIALLGFALAVWRLIAQWSVPLALLAASILWLALAIGAWWLRRRLGHRRPRNARP